MPLEHKLTCSVRQVTVAVGKGVQYYRLADVFASSVRVKGYDFIGYKDPAKLSDAQVPDAPWGVTTLRLKTLPFVEAEVWVRSINATAGVPPLEGSVNSPLNAIDRDLDGGCAFAASVSFVPDTSSPSSGSGSGSFGGDSYWSGSQSGRWLAYFVLDLGLRIPVSSITVAPCRTPGAEFDLVSVRFTDDLSGGVDGYIKEPAACDVYIDQETVHVPCPGTARYVVIVGFPGRGADLAVQEITVYSPSPSALHLTSTDARPDSVTVRSVTAYIGASSSDDVAMKRGAEPQCSAATSPASCSFGALPVNRYKIRGSSGTKGVVSTTLALPPSSWEWVATDGYIFQTAAACAPNGISFALLTNNPDAPYDRLLTPGDDYTWGRVDSAAPSGYYNPVYTEGCLLTSNASNTVAVYVFTNSSTQHYVAVGETAKAAALAAGYRQPPQVLGYALAAQTAAVWAGCSRENAVGSASLVVTSPALVFGAVCDPTRGFIEGVALITGASFQPVVDIALGIQQFEVAAVGLTPNVTLNAPPSTITAELSVRCAVDAVLSRASALCVSVVVRSGRHVLSAAAFSDEDVASAPINQTVDVVTVPIPPLIFVPPEEYQSINDTILEDMYANNALVTGGMIPLTWTISPETGGAPIENVTVEAYATTTDAMSGEVLRSPAAFKQVVPKNAFVQGEQLGHLLLVNGLTQRTSYVIIVTAANQYFVSSQRRWSTKTAPACLPSPPKNLVLSTLTGGAAAVTWAPPIDDGGTSVTGYKLIVRAEINQEHIITELTLASTVLSYPIFRLHYDLAYIVEVTALTSFCGSVAAKSATLTVPLRNATVPAFSGTSADQPIVASGRSYIVVEMKDAPLDTSGSASLSITCTGPWMTAPGSLFFRGN